MPLVEASRDVDPEVRLEAIRALGALRRDAAVPVLRDLATGTTGGVADPGLRREAVEALAAIGTSDAREALSNLARRRVWPWQRAERRIRALAASAVSARRDTEEASDE
jgi:HEAT repeat protein